MDYTINHDAVRRHGGYAVLLPLGKRLPSNKHAKACLKSALADFPAEVIIPYVKGYFKSTKTGNARISAFPVP